MSPTTSTYRPLSLDYVDRSFPHRREVEACIRLARLAAQHLGGTRFDLKPGTGNEVVLVHFVQATRIFEAMIHLCLDGTAGPGEMLARPLIEVALTASWAHRHPEEADHRFRLHRKAALVRYAQLRKDDAVFIAAIGDVDPLSVRRRRRRSGCSDLSSSAI